MTRPISVLVLGASYGMLIAVRLAQTEAHVTLVCTAEEQEDLLAHGAQVDFRGKHGIAGVEVKMPVRRGSATEAGQLGVVGCDVDVCGIDLVFLVFSEPQCAAPQPSTLLSRIAQQRVPVVSLMNCLPPPYLNRLPSLPTNELMPAYSAWSVWSQFDSSVFTAASPDAQAFRPTESSCRLIVGLSSNFKVAPFHQSSHQALLQKLAFDTQHSKVFGQRIPVDLVAHKSLTIPLAKWPMLLAGNCRCVLSDGTAISIAQAIWQDIEVSCQVYEWVCDVALICGANKADLVPFRVYAAVAKSLKRPSSMARAILARQVQVERVDKVVQLAGAALGKFSPEVDRIVERIDLLLLAR